jgi:hypothetical protein
MARDCVDASMEIDWGENEPRARWDWFLVEQGAQLELLEHGGLYADLYERQFQAWESASPQPVVSSPQPVV